MAQWNEEDHPRDEDGKFTFKNGGSITGGAASIDNIDDKMQKRAEILFPNTQVSQAQRYFDNRKETDPIKKYENIGLGNFEQSLKNKSEETAQRWTPECNAKFSDSEVKRARKFIQGNKGLRLDAHYPTTNDVLTIGYGHTGNVDGKPITKGMIISEAKVEELYRKDFEIHTAPLKEVKVPLTNNQKIALASFAYNMGPTGFRKSSVCRKLNEGDFKGVADAFGEYIKQTNKKTGKKEIVNGLITRRQLEKKLFLTPDTK